MDWLRRNWPDLLIGVALIAVIAGIIATLISGGSFFPSGNRTVETPQPSTTVTSDPPAASPVQPGDAGQQDPGSSAAGSSAAVETPQSSSLTATPSTPSDDAAAAQDAQGSPEAADQGASDAAESSAASEPASQQSSAGGLPVAVLPSTPAGSSNAAAGSSAAGQAQPTAAATPAPSSSSVSSSVGATAASQAGGNTIISASDTPDAPYRVSVGAYANRDNAQRQAEAFAAAGYPVFIGEQGNLNIVLVGPYDSESQARSVAERIRSSDMGVSDPTVYEFEADDTSQASSAVASASAPTPATPASSVSASQQSSAAEQDPVIASAPAGAPGVRYLQAGAYGTRESSLPQRERLEGLGFVVTERLESDLVKLLIGPFDAADLQSAQSRLEAAGIASFPR